MNHLHQNHTSNLTGGGHIKASSYGLGDQCKIDGAGQLAAAEVRPAEVARAFQIVDGNLGHLNYLVSALEGRLQMVLAPEPKTGAGMDNAVPTFDVPMARELMGVSNVLESMASRVNSMLDRLGL